jgi:hypothetical protein
MCDEHLENWRSRRLHACRAAGILERIASNLGVESNELPPEGGLPVISEPDREQVKILIAFTLRQILLLNDGRISHQTLQRF